MSSKYPPYGKPVFVHRDQVAQLDRVVTLEREKPERRNLKRSHLVAEAIALLLEQKYPDAALSVERKEGDPAAN